MRKTIETIDHAISWDAVLSEVAEYTVEQAVHIQQIPAPTFHEALRAEYVRQQFAAAGLGLIEIDEVFNVYGLLRGADSSLPAVMVAAHTDTVFPAETELATHYQDDLIYGPGLGDNSVGVAGLFGLLALLDRLGMTPQSDIWFVATSREEGLGDLGGMKAAYARLKSKIRAVINLEGLALGHIYHAGIAVRRLHITATAEGGHSWLHFGRASAIHGIIQLGARITNLKMAHAPRTTYNIGMIEGGQSINSIASRAGMWLDMRSEAPDALDDLERRVRAAIKAVNKSDLTFDVAVVGDRPAGALATSHDLVQGALAALERVGIRGSLETGSTDGNVPLADGCPTVTVGITRGGNAHRLDEYIEVRPVATGLHQLALITLATCQTESSAVNTLDVGKPN
jgi:acetylornithine deacetylase/succinyl-diaminopimelate desuccinylase-like protein